jgi:hypothetical protein
MLRLMGGFSWTVSDWPRCFLRGDMLMPIALTDSELDIIFSAARPLQVEDRDPFLQAIAERLAAIPERGDGIVFQVCREIQRQHWTPPIGIEVTGMPRKSGTRD